MFNLGGGEILVILVVALLVLGPDKLPRFMRTVGKAVGDLRRASTDFQRTMNLELTEKETASDAKKPETAAPETLPESEPEQPEAAVTAPADPKKAPHSKPRLRAVPPRRTPRRGMKA